jgi:hypothetical protein
MRVRVALLVAAAVGFAPGWYGQDAPHDPRGVDLAAGVLASAVDGAVREGTADLKHLSTSRQDKRWRPSLTSAAIASSGLRTGRLVIHWLVTGDREQLLLSNRLSHRFRRAPPSLRRA